MNTNESLAKVIPLIVIIYDILVSFSNYVVLMHVKISVFATRITRF